MAFRACGLGIPAQLDRLAGGVEPVPAMTGILPRAAFTATRTIKVVLRAVRLGASPWSRIPANALGAGI